MEITDNNKTVQEVFYKKPEPKNKFLIKGLTFVVAFWAVFSLTFLSLKTVKNNDLSSTIAKIGNVLGISSDWNTKVSKEYLLNNKEKILNSQTKGTVIASIVKEKVNSNSNQVVTVNVDFDTTQKTALLETNDLSKKITQDLATEKYAYTRYSSSEKWVRYVYNSSTKPDLSKTPTYKIQDILLSEEVINKYTLFKGISNSNGKSIVSFSVELKQVDYNNLLKTYSLRSDKTFDFISINYKLDLNTNSIDTIEIGVNNLVENNEKYTINKEITYKQLEDSKASISNLVPSNSEITDSRNTLQNYLPSLLNISSIL